MFELSHESATHDNIQPVMFLELRKSACVRELTGTIYMNITENVSHCAILL